jgi:hypothetical protein
MSEYKRLTERRETPLVMSMWGGSSRDLRVYNRLAELENKIEQGTLIELPCKVGDTVYAVKKKALRTHWDEHRYIVDDWDEWKVCELPFSLTLWECGGILGKDYYLTREEAEKRLLELQGDK